MGLRESRRRTISSCILLFVAAFVVVGVVTTDTTFAINKKDIKKLVDEYADEGTSDDRKEAIIKRLKLGQKGTLKKEMGKLLKKKDLRESVFEICGALEVPLPFKEAKKHVDSDYQAKVLKTLFLNTDKKAQKFLFDRWKKAAQGDGDYGVINASFQENWVGPKVLSMFHDELMGSELGDEKKTDIESILKYQMVLNDDEAAKLRTHWKSLYGVFAMRSRVFPIKGKNILLQDGWNSEESGYNWEGVTKFRDKYILEPHASLYLPKLKLRNFRVKVWVMPLTGTSEKVGVGMNGNALVGARFQNGIWQATISNSADGTGPKNTLPAKVNQWVDFEFSSSGGGVLVSIGGKELVVANPEYGQMAQSIGIYAGSKGRMIVGAVDYIK